MTDLTEYEQRRLENIRRNQLELKLLGLDVKPVPIKKKKVVARKPKVKSEVKPRISLRISGLDPNGINQKPNLAKLQKVLLNESIEGTIKLEPNELDNFDYFKENLPPIEDNNYRDLSMQFNDGSVQVTDEMIYSIAVHPSTVGIYCAVGDKHGSLSTWNITHDIKHQSTVGFKPQVSTIKPHSKAISKIMYLESTSKVLTSSYDGSIRSTDFKASVNVEKYNHPNNRKITHLDVAQGDRNCWFTTDVGDIGQFDLRANPKNVQEFSFTRTKVNTIHINPVSQQYIIVAIKNAVNLFDTRFLDRENPRSLSHMEHSRSVNSAYWNPQGDKIVSSSFDNTVTIWSNVASGSPSIASIRHYNAAGNKLLIQADSSKKLKQYGDPIQKMMFFALQVKIHHCRYTLVMALKLPNYRMTT